MVWPWVSGEVSWVANGVAVGFRWVSDGVVVGSQVRLEWVTEGSLWLRFCGFLFSPPVVVAKTRGGVTA